VPEVSEESLSPGDYASLRASVELAQEANANLFREFFQLAGPAAMLGMQVDLLNIRVFTLARHLLGEDTPAMLRFQFEFEQQTAEMLRETMAEVRKVQLGVQASPQQVQHLARGNGLLGPNGRPLS
jgi:hypothetical protein